MRILPHPLRMTHLSGTFGVLGTRPCMTRAAMCPKPGLGAPRHETWADDL